MSFTRVSARFAWPSTDLLEGGGTGPQRPGPESGTKGSGFVTTRAIAIAGTLACAMLCDSVAIAADGGVAVHAPPVPAETAAVATDMRVGGDDKQTRVVVDLNRKIDLAAFTLADPY